MIGRAAQGRPWFCGQVAAAIAGSAEGSPSLAEQGALLSEHVAALHDFYGPIPGRASLVSMWAGPLQTSARWARPFVDAQ